MIGLDTNALVRLLVGDDAAQQRAARRHLAHNASEQNPAWVNRIVAIETVWVLERSYHLSRDRIAEALNRLLLTAELLFEDHEKIRNAVDAYQHGADFSDALIAQGNAEAGCAHTVTFDKTAARRVPAFTVIGT